MARALGITEFFAKKFDELNFEGSWCKTFGKPESNFSAIFYGKSGNGKTEFVVMLAKYLTRFGTVLYNSYEQGHSKSLQDSFKRQNMQEVTGKIVVAHKEPWDEMIKRLRKKKSANTVVLDSIQYARVTYTMWQELRNLFPRKRFLLISHANGDEPDGYHAKKIEFDVDIKVLIKYYVAHPKSRFGGNEEYMIYPEGHVRMMNRIRNKGKNVEANPKALELPLLPQEPNLKAV